MLERPSINQLLDDSVEAIKAYQMYLKKNETSPTRVKPLKGIEEEVLRDLFETLTNTTVELERGVSQERVELIEMNKLVAVEEAITQLMTEPTTENKINAMQFAIFGVNIPLLQMLRTTQNLLHTVEGLKETRGKKASKIEDMGKGKGTKR